MNPLKFIKDIFKPAANLIDDLHTSVEEKGKIKEALDTIASNVVGQFIELQTKYLEAQSSVIKAEANGSSWIQRNWRPVTMLTFVVLIVLDALGLLPNRLNPAFMELVKYGLGGYVVGRSIEKSVNSWRQK
jgi:hypothetical protein